MDAADEEGKALENVGGVACENEGLSENHPKEAVHADYSKELQTGYSMGAPSGCSKLVLAHCSSWDPDHSTYLHDYYSMEDNVVGVPGEEEKGAAHRAIEIKKRQKEN